MKVIGITGGIGSGKTFVCRIFETLGIAVYNADMQAKKLMNEHLEIKTALKNLFGASIYDATEQLNRALLAQHIFSNPQHRAMVNGIVHPAVATDFELWKKQQKGSYIIKESAILFESGANKGTDAVICVTAPKELRVERAMKRDGLSRERVLMIMKSQWTDEDRLDKCQHHIINDEQKALLPQVLTIHQLIISGS
jgi:dephospho-CoA kinase